MTISDTESMSLILLLLGIFIWVADMTGDDHAVLVVASIIALLGLLGLIVW